MQRALLLIDGVHVVDASHTARRVDVEADPPLDEARIAAAIEDAGFDVIAVRA